MKKLILQSFVVASLLFGANTNASTTIGWAAAAGNFLSSGGSALSAGGVSIGYFTSAPADAAFGTTINSWADLLTAGYIDIRTMPSVATGGLDWDYPLAGGGGSVTSVPFAASTSATALAANHQLYVIAFNNGTFNTATPANSFTGATEWAVVKDNANLAPADLGTKNVLLSTAIGSTEILRGTDNGSNVNLTALSAGPVPEPSRLMLLGLAGLGLVFRRRRC